MYITTTYDMCIVQVEAGWCWSEGYLPYQYKSKNTDTERKKGYVHSAVEAGWCWSEGRED